MSLLSLRRVIPVLIVSTFSSILAQASDQKNNAEELSDLNKRKVVMEAYPILNFPIFSGSPVKAPDQINRAKRLDVLNKQIAVMQSFEQLISEYNQRDKDLQKAKDVLKREETKAEEREELAKAGKFIQASDPRSTLANYNNGYTSLGDVLKSKSDLLASHPAPDDPIHLEPLAYIREDVQQKEENLDATAIFIKEFLGTCY